MNNTGRKRLVRFGAALLVFALLPAAVIFSGTLSASAGERQSAAMLQGTPVVGFKFQSYSVPEGGTASISVVISQAPVTTATVEYLTVDGTATSPGRRARCGAVPASGMRVPCDQGLGFRACVLAASRRVARARRVALPIRPVAEIRPARHAGHTGSARCFYAVAGC